jgi:hypothetical protein
MLSAFIGESHCMHELKKRDKDRTYLITNIQQWPNLFLVVAPSAYVFPAKFSHFL